MVGWAGAQLLSGGASGWLTHSQEPKAQSPKRSHLSPERGGKLGGQRCWLRRSIGVFATRPLVPTAQLALLSVGTAFFLWSS
jgi:hypothetical protein